MSTHNIGFYGDLRQLIPNYHQISSNTHLTCQGIFSSISEYFVLFEDS